MASVIAFCRVCCQLETNSLDGRRGAFDLPLELLTGVRPRNKAEAELTNLLGEASVLEDPLLRLACLGSLRDEWIQHSREAKVTATTKFICKDLKAEERVLVWSGRERSGKGKKLNACWIGLAELLWVGDKGGCLVLFIDSGKLRVLNASKVKRFWQ